MSLCVKPLRPKSKAQGFNPSYVFIISCMILLVIFASFLKLNSKTQIIMDNHRHKILIIFVFFMVISKKKKKFLPSFINKHKSSTRRSKNEKKDKI
jgi:hypothetical protein